MQRRVLLFLGLLVCVPAVAQATVTLTAGNHVLLANTPGQVIDILVSADGGEGVNALDLYMDIDGAVGPAPVITAFNPWGAPTVWDGAVFTDAGYGPPPPPDTLEFAQGVFLNNSASNVSGNGVIAQMTIDTSGFFFGDGPWVFRLENNTWGETALGNSSGPVAYVRVDGELSIIPEPASLVMGLFAAAALGVVVIRRRRARKAA